MKKAKRDFPMSAIKSNKNKEQEKKSTKQTNKNKAEEERAPEFRALERQDFPALGIQQPHDLLCARENIGHNRA
jgi:hypothetical protein